MSSSPSYRQKLLNSAELIRKGATLLGEACPRCGGVQIKYQNRTYCLNEDDLPSILGAPSAAPEKNTAREEGFQSAGLARLLEEKLSEVSKQLQSSNDPVEQAKLLELITKYVDTLDNLKKKASR